MGEGEGDWFVKTDPVSFAEEVQKNFRCPLS